MRLCLLPFLPLFVAPAFADTASTALASYDGSVRKAYEKESKSQCLARARRSPDEIVVCGEVERKDRFRLQKSGTVVIQEHAVQSPAEKFLSAQSAIAASQSTVGTGYTSSLANIGSGYIRRSYKVVTNMFKGEDPDLE
jgi:hypothetical protein